MQQNEDDRADSILGRLECSILSAEVIGLSVGRLSANKFVFSSA
jgi:hypothetical protein